MKVYVVAIGNEILEGSILDTNSNYIVHQLSISGINCNGIYATSDSKKDLQHLLKWLLKENSLIITTGGLGPTFDDITIDAVAEVCHKPLKLSKAVYFDILNKVKTKGIRLKTSHLKQTYIPKDSKIIPNQYGTAPGIYIECKKNHIICLPGVPSEMRPMFENYVSSVISRIVKHEELYRCDLKLIGITESDADEFLKKLDNKNTKIILNAMEGELAIRVRSNEKERVDSIKKAFLDRFGLKVYSQNNENIEDVVGDLLEKLDLNIAFIESITAGYLSQMMYEKKCFAGSLVKFDIEESSNIFSRADIVANPCNLSGNEFELKIKILTKELSVALRYLGNINFMRKSVSKRTLGFIYEYLKQHYD